MPLCTSCSVDSVALRKSLLEAGEGQRGDASLCRNESNEEEVDKEGNQWSFAGIKRQGTAKENK